LTCAINASTTADALDSLHGGNRGSNPLGDANKNRDLYEVSGHSLVVPAAELAATWNAVRNAAEPFQQLARGFKVSPIVAARRAWDLSPITPAAFFEKSDGGHFYATQNTRIAKRFARIVDRAAKEGRLLYGDAYDPTGLSGATFDQYIKSLEVDTPEDPELLKQFARASMLHAHLDNTLKMFIRSFDATTVEDALTYIGYGGAAPLRKRVTQLAKERLGEGEALAMVLDFMKRCEDVSERRNELLHSPIGRERDGPAFRMRARGGNTWVELPKPEALKALADETYKLVEEMNHQRLAGTVDAALRQRKKPLK
jgi:hypothetical protein